MILSGYRLLSQLRAGKDGVAYRAEQSESGEPVEFRDLTRARANSRRWTRLSTQLQRLGLVAHRCMRRLVEIRLDDDLPFVVLGPTPDRTLADVLGGDSIGRPAGSNLAAGIAGLLASAHGLGVAHGNLRPSQIWLDARNQPLVDFTYFVATGSVPSVAPPDFDDLCSPGDTTGVAADLAANDIFALGAILALLHGCDPSCLAHRGDGHATLEFARPVAAEMQSLIQSMLAADPLDRPLADEVARILHPQPPGATGEAPAATEPSPAPSSVDRTGDREVVGAETILLPAGHAIDPEALLDPTRLEGRRLGRFQLVERRGAGATGSVYRAIDTADGSAAAVKVLHPQYAARSDAVKRFRQEAQLLSEIDNPHVARLFEVNYDQGLHYLAMEYVAGRSLADLLSERVSIEPPQALSILSDVARALVEPHDRGIIHRDVKPDNILVQIPGDTGDGPPGGGTPAPESQTLSANAPLGAAKLVDFGLARNLFESRDTNLTRVGGILGTPAYMSPEQATGGPIGPETDIYAMGATLFHAVAGRPPFAGTDPWSLINQHCNEAPPRVSAYRSDIPAGLAELVDRMLCKTPADRHADASALLADLDRLSRGEPMAIEMHPLAPSDRRGALEFDFTWELASPPHALWPHVANTERLNEAIGLPPVQYAPQVGADGRVEQLASADRLGMKLEWREHAFEWVEGRHLSVLREFHKGPFKWFINVVKLQPSPAGGTQLTHRVVIQPRSVLGRAAAALEVGVKARRALKRVYHHIDQAVAARQQEDPFRAPGRMRAARSRRLDELLGRLEERGVDGAVARRLGDHIARAPAQEIARIRPLALAARLGLDPESAVEACLAAAHEGLLVLLWDIVCPLCRIPSDIKDTLGELQTHGKCQACNLDFELDFAQSVELIFRASPQIREADAGTYCIGGPAHSPHVAAQVRVAPHESIKLDLSLEAGSYRLRGIPSSLAADFEVSVPGQAALWEFDVDAPASGRVADLTANRQRLLLNNGSPAEHLVRIERTSPRSHVLTAARATSMAAFRKLFPREILSADDMVGVSAMSLMTTGLPGAAGVPAVEAAIHAREYFRAVSDVVERRGGSLLKTAGNHFRAVFHLPEQAVRAALETPRALAGNETTAGLRPRIAIDHGPVVAMTLRDQLDYIGETAETADRLFAMTEPGELLMTARVAGDPVVAVLLDEHDLHGTLSTLEPGNPRTIIHRCRLDAAMPRGHTVP